MSHHHHKKHHISAEEVFKHTFMTEFLAFKHEAERFSRGAISFSGSWKDWLGVAGFSGTFAVGSAVLSAITLFGIVSSVASIGIGLGIALVAIGAEVGYTLYRSKKKSREYQRASNFLSNENAEEEINIITDHLANLYLAQINECKSKEDVEGLALTCFQLIKYELMKNKSLNYDDLLHAGLLQGILLKNASHVMKKTLHLEAAKKEDCNMRSVIIRSVLYCAENDKFYASEHSRPEKYGVLMFKTKEELDDFRIMSEKMKGPQHLGKYGKLRSTDAEILRHGKFFKHHKHHINNKMRKHQDEDSMEMSVELRR